MKRDIKKILGSADAEKIAEDYKAVDRKTSQRMFSGYLKKVGTANNQFSETTENSEIYKFENTHILRRIAALAAYGAAFVLLIGATVGIIKMKGPKNNKLNPSPQPEISATESQTENNSSANPTDKKDKKIDKEKTSSYSANSVKKTDSDNNSPNTDTAINDSEANNSSEGNVFEVNFTEGWIWRRNPTNGKPEPEEADLTSETLSILISLRDRGELNPCVWH